MADATEEFLLTANTQRAVEGDVRIAAGNFWSAPYPGPGGQELEGLTCALWILEQKDAPQRHVRVHPGATLELAGKRLEVLEVAERQVRLRLSDA